MQSRSFKNLIQPSEWKVAAPLKLLAHLCSLCSASPKDVLREYHEERARLAESHKLPPAPVASHSFRSMPVPSAPAPMVPPVSAQSSFTKFGSMNEQRTAFAQEHTSPANRGAPVHDPWDSAQEKLQNLLLQKRESAREMRFHRKQSSVAVAQMQSLYSNSPRNMPSAVEMNQPLPQGPAKEINWSNIPVPEMAAPAAPPS